VTAIISSAADSVGEIKIKKYKDGLQEVRCDWMHAFSGALGEL